MHQMFSKWSEADTNISLILTALEKFVKSFFGPLSTPLWPPGEPSLDYEHSQVHTALDSGVTTAL